MPEPWREHEDRDDGRERELEPRVEHVPRIPREQDDRSDEERVPAVALAAAEPGKRAERARDAGADHRRLRPHREHVRGDRREGGELGREARDAEQEREPDRAAGHDDDVAAADRQQVIEARGPKALPERVRETAVLTEHDALKDRATLSREAGGRRTREPRV